MEETIVILMMLMVPGSLSTICQSPWLDLFSSIQLPEAGRGKEDKCCGNTVRS